MSAHPHVVVSLIDDLGWRDLFRHSNQAGTSLVGVRQGDWKLIEFFEQGKPELYNLRDDIGQTSNPALSEPKRAAALHGRLQRGQRKVQSLFNKPNPHFNLLPLDMQTDPAEV